MHVACKHGSVGGVQSAALLQQPAAPVEPKTQRLLVHAVAVWQPLAGAQSLGALQQGDAPAAVKPQAPALHVAAWHELPAGQATQALPQNPTSLSALHVPLQSWKPLLHV
jgi:hypothetical protein